VRTQSASYLLSTAGTLLVAELPYPDAPEAYREQPAYRLLAGVQLHEAGRRRRDHPGRAPDLLESAGFTELRVATQPLPTRLVMLATSQRNGGAAYP
jgi:hypothetical protein